MRITWLWFSAGHDIDLHMDRYLHVTRHQEVLYLYCGAGLHLAGCQQQEGQSGQLVAGQTGHTIQGDNTVQGWQFTVGYLLITVTPVICCRYLDIKSKVETQLNKHKSNRGRGRNHCAWQSGQLSDESAWSSMFCWTSVTSSQFPQH